MVLGFGGSLWLAATVDSQGGLSDLAPGALTSLGMVLFGFAVAAILVDPLSRRYGQLEREREWSAVGEATLDFAMRAVKNVVVYSRFPLYLHVDRESGAPEDMPRPQELTYFDVLNSPLRFIEIADKMLQAVRRYLDADLHSHTLEMGRFVQEQRAKEGILRSLERLRDGARMYNTLPVIDAEAHGALTACRIAAMDYEDALWATQEVLSRVGDRLTGEFQSGSLSALTQSLAGSALEAFGRLHRQASRLP